MACRKRKGSNALVVGFNASNIIKALNRSKH